MTSLWSAIPVALLLVTVAATVVAYFRASLAKATIDTLKESNAALAEQVTILKAEQIATTARMESVERENELLRSAPQVAFHKLSNAIDHHHAEVTRDRAEFAQSFRAAMVTVGDKLDANQHAIQDVIRLVGGHRTRDAS